MRYLNEQEEQRLNKILQQFSAPKSTEKIEVMMGRNIVYRGVPGETPDIDRIAPKQLENLEQAVTNPEKSTGSVTLSKKQVYQVQDGQPKINNLQSLQQIATSSHSNQSPDITQLQSSLFELKGQSEKQQAELAKLQAVILKQSELLEKASTPIHQRIGNWFNQLKENVTERVQAFNKSVQGGWEKAQQQVQDFADGVTGRTALRQEVKRLQKELQQVKAQQPQGDRQPEKKVEVKLADLKNWQKEAKAVGRSEQELKTIERIVDLAKKKTNNNPAASFAIKEGNFKAMQHDCQKFNELAFELIAKQRERQIPDQKKGRSL